MDISNRIEGNCVILDLQVDTFEYPKTMVLKNHVLRLIEEGQHTFLLNLSSVQMIDSFAIASFISILKLCKSHNGRFSLYGLNDSAKRLMELTHMDRVLDIWETESEALESLKAST